MHQFDYAQLNALPEFWPLYVKAGDENAYQGTWDRSYLAVDGPHGSDSWTWENTGYVPWWNLTGWQPAATARLCGETIQHSGRLILDIEPYDNGPAPDHWVKGEAEASTFQTLFNNARENAPFDMTIDYRRVADQNFPYPWWIAQADRIIPQVYWTTFQRPWRSVLEDAARVLEPLGHEIEWLLPGNASADDMRAALDWIAERGEHASVWLWQTIRNDVWQVLHEYTAE